MVLFSIIVNQIVPYWAVGIVISSVISVFSKAKIHKLFASTQGKDIGLLGIVPASLLGIASPLCMFGTIPVAASFSAKGMRQDWLAAFMMSSILLNPQLMIYSAALGSTVFFIRIASGFLCGVLAGVLVNIFYKNKTFFNFSSFKESAGRDTDPNLFLRLLKNIWRNIKATGVCFLAGIIIIVLFSVTSRPTVCKSFRKP